MKAYLAIAALVLSSGAWAADGNTMNVTGGTVQFLAIGRPSAIKIHGKGGAPTGTILIQGTAVTGQLAFDLNSLDTEIDMRNKHMKEKYLETGKYPSAVFKITHLSLPSGGAQSADSIPVDGTLTLHGVTKPVKAVATIKRSATDASAHVEFDMNLTDYSISIPNFAGIKVADKVTIDVDVLSHAASPLHSQKTTSATTE